jgi:hypothetical protein
MTEITALPTATALQSGDVTLIVRTTGGTPAGMQAAASLFVGATGATGATGAQGTAGATGATGPAGSDATVTQEAVLAVLATLPTAQPTESGVWWLNSGVPNLSQ